MADPWEVSFDEADFVCNYSDTVFTLRGDDAFFFGQGGFPVRVLFWAQKDEPRHGHDFTELVFVTQGSATHLAGEHEVPVKMGDVFVIPEGAQHAYAATSDFELYNVLFSVENLPIPRTEMEEMPGYRALFRDEPELRRSGNAPCHLHLSFAELAIVTSWARELNDVLSKKPAGFRFQALVLLLEIIRDISCAYSKLAHCQPKALVRIAPLTRYIEAHLAEDIRLSTLGRLAGMGERSLRRSFQEAFSCSPMEYILAARISAAKQLLATDGLNITEIAAAVGLRDSSYFSRSFRRATGQTPRAYRLALRNSPRPLPEALRIH